MNEVSYDIGRMKLALAGRPTRYYWFLDVEDLFQCSSFVFLFLATRSLDPTAALTTATFELTPSVAVGGHRVRTAPSLQVCVCVSVCVSARACVCVHVDPPLKALSYPLSCSG